MRCCYGELSGCHCRRKATTTRPGYPDVRHLCGPCAKLTDEFERSRGNRAIRARADQAWKAKHPSAQQCDDIAAAYELDAQWAFHADYWRDRAERLREGASV